MQQVDLNNLHIWKRSVDLAENVYKLTKQFPKEELYSLTNQIRRAVVSVPSNIAEGSQRTTTKDFAHFILIAKGSLAELQTQLLLSHRFAYINQKQWTELQQEIVELHRMLHAFYTQLINR